MPYNIDTYNWRNMTNHGHDVVGLYCIYIDSYYKHTVKSASCPTQYVHTFMYNINI